MTHLFSIGNVVQPPMLVKEDASSSILVCGTEFKHLFCGKNSLLILQILLKVQGIKTNI